MTDSVTPQPHVPVETKGKQKTIAVVTEVWHLRALVRAAVENKRTRVAEASNLQAISAIAHRERLDLVILDADLVCGDATAPYAQLKRDPALADVPLILLTDRTTPDDGSSTSVSHPDRTLHKHFSPFELLNLVYTLTGY
ncbi:MAG: response regulator [Chloroflexi bacterium]|nr:response regulator [Chloroflexota bacterium]